MTIENCANTFADSSSVREVDPVISFASISDGICDLTDGVIRNICFPLDKESDFAMIGSINQQIAAALGDGIELIPLVEQNGMLVASVPLETVGACTIREGYTGKGRGATLIKTIHEFTKDNPHMKELACRCWGINNYSDQVFVHIPIGNTE